MNIENENIGFNSAVLFLNEKFRNLAKNIDPEAKKSIYEIRVRVNKALAFICYEKTYFLCKDGKISEDETDFIVSPIDISEIIEILCKCSIYSYQNQIKDGFIPLKYGHRAGICGTAVIDKAQINSVRDISSINIRVAKEIKGCSRKILEKIGYYPKGTIIAGPPASGKTTILRDLARILSSRLSGYKKVSIVDERSEIAATYKGVPQFDIGISDVLNSYPKHLGIMHAVRTLSSDIIICDEMGLALEVSAVDEGLKSGCQLITSVHLESKENLLSKKQVRDLLKTSAFENIIVLNEESKCTGDFDFIKVEDLYAKNDRNYFSNNIWGFRWPNSFL